MSRFTAEIRILASRWRRGPVVLIRHSARLLLPTLAIGVALSQLPSVDGAEQGGDVAAAPSVDTEIDRWIAELNADEYGVRDRAMHGLITAGGRTIGPLETILENADLESATRAIYVLHRLALSGERTTEEDARRVLEKTAAPRVTAAARRATEALGQIADAMQQRSLEELSDLGAQVVPDYEEFGFTGVRLFAVIFDDKWRGEEDDLRRLRWLRDVEQISFIGEQVNDRWLSYLEGMERLMLIKIGRATITNASLGHFQTLRRLQVVKLIYVPVTDEAVPYLAACPQIRTLIAYGTEMTDSSRQPLAEAGITADLKRGAFLGIVVPGARNGTDWYIEQVTPDSAAEKAGLKRGDVITKYGDKAVTDFASLQEMIGRNKGGDRISVEIRRDGRLIRKEVTFGEWQ